MGSLRRQSQKDNAINLFTTVKNRTLFPSDLPLKSWLHFLTSESGRVTTVNQGWSVDLGFSV